MKKTIYLILLNLCLLITACGNMGSGESPPTPTESPPEAVTSDASVLELEALKPELPSEPALSQRQQDWSNDLNYLKRQYKMDHIDPFYYCSEEEFNWKLDQLAAKADDLNDIDIYFELAAIIAGMGDIHTLAIPPSSVYDRMFPVYVRYWGDSLYLCGFQEGYEQFSDFQLHEIVAVNGVDITYLRKKVESIIAPFNIWYSKEYVGGCFLPALIDWVDCGYKNDYTLQILDENREVKSIELPVVSYEDYTAGIWVMPEAWDSLSYLKGGNWAEYLEGPNGGCVYMSFTEMMRNYEAPYQEFLEETAGVIHSHPECSKLVIDLRFHPGGIISTFNYFRENINMLKAPWIEQTYVITGGYTTSAAIRCAALFKDELNAVLVGEPTGQFTSFFAHRITRTIVLPLSQLSIQVSTKWSDGKELVAPIVEEYYDENDRLYEWENTILPDVFVYQDIKDVRQGKDSVLEWVFVQQS